MAQSDKANTAPEESAGTGTEQPGSGGGVDLDPVQAGIDMAVDAMDDLMEKTNYGNPVSSVIASLGNMFNTFLPNAIGEFLNTALKKVADKIDKAVNPNADARAQEHQMLAGGGFTDVTREVADVVGLNPDAFAADMKSAAAMLKDGTAPADGVPNQVMDVGAAISGSAKAYPLATAEALEAFSSVGEAWLSEHGEDYPGAEKDVKAVNQAMAEYYFESVMQAEAAGWELSEADRQAIGEFRMYGVDMAYDEFLEDHGEEFEKPRGDARVVRSDGSLEAGTGLDTESIRAAAEAEVNRGAMADHREDLDGVAGWEASTAETVVGIREAGPAGMGEAYMARLAEMQAYNDAAVSAIVQKYADDPEGRLAAEAGLAMRMQAGVGPLFDAMKEDQAAHGCFSDEQLEAVAGLKLTGVDVSYEDYVPGTGLCPIDASREDDGLYANAFGQDAGQGVLGTPSPDPGVEAGTSGTKKSYGDLAESKFGGIVDEKSGKDEYSIGE